MAIQEYNGKQFCYIINRNFVDYLPNELPLSDMISTWEAILLHLYEHCRLFAQHEWPLSNIIGNYENRKPESRAESVLTDNYESASRITPPPTPGVSITSQNVHRSPAALCANRLQKEEPQEEGNSIAEIEGDERRQTLVLLSV